MLGSKYVVTAVTNHFLNRKFWWFVGRVSFCKTQSITRLLDAGKLIFSYPE